MAIHEEYKGPAVLAGVMKEPEIGAVAAIGRNRALGKGNELLWRIPDDLKRFKELTLGHPLIFGRKTYDSIGRPLPGRTNIVVTRDPYWKQEGVVIATSIEDAIAKAKALDSEKIYIGGGAQIYAQALPYTTKLYLTLIDDEKEADTFFPEYESEFSQVTFEENREFEGINYRWIDLVR